MAVRSLEQARDMWRQLAPSVAPASPVAKQQVTLNSQRRGAPQAQNEARLRPEQELFFMMSLGSVYESSGKDEIAISCYMNAIS